MNLFSYETYMYIISAASSLFYFIQAYKTFKTKSSKDLSLIAYIFLLIVGISWGIYAIQKSIGPLIIGGIFQLIGVCLVIYLIIKYKNNDPKIEENLKTIL